MIVLGDKEEKENIGAVGYELWIYFTSRVTAGDPYGKLYWRSRPPDLGAMFVSFPRPTKRYTQRRGTFGPGDSREDVRYVGRLTIGLTDSNNSNRT